MSTPLPSVSQAGDAALPTTQLEVATTGSDALRARVRVTGRLTAGATPLLISVLRTHIVAGRRYLRVDLARATFDEPAVTVALVDLHRQVESVGGMIVFDHAGAALLDAMRAATFAADRTV